MTEKTGSNNSSLARNFNIFWALRLLITFIKIDIVLLLLAVAGLVCLSENQGANGYALYKQDEALNIPQIIFSLTDEPAGIKPPAWLGKILPESTRDAYRYIKYTGPEPSGTNNPDIYSFYYCICLEPLDGKPICIAYNIGSYLQITVYFFVILLVIQALSWLDNIRRGIITSRRILRPITDLAQVTTALRGHNLLMPQTNTLKELAGTIGQIDADRLNTRLSVDGTQQELKELARAINSMLERIDQSYNSQAQFVSDASHELKTPIAVIQGYANLLDRWGKNDEKTLQESIDAIKSEAHRMKKLVDDLLFLARGDSDSLSLNVEPVDLRLLLDEVYRETLMLDPEHQLEYQSPAEDIIIQADAALIKQVIRVLIDNAINYTPVQEQITVSLNRHEGWVKINVQDSGIGISTADLPKIFDRFYRSDPSRTRNTGGTGLGLSIAHWIVEKHGGHFEVLSRLDLGTRITICLPE